MLNWGWKLFYTTQITMTLINDGNSRKRERFQILCECNSGCHLSLSIRKESPIVEALARLLWVPIDVVPAHRVFSSFRPNHLCELKTKFYHSVRASHPATLISNLNAPEIFLFIFWALWWTLVLLRSSERRLIEPKICSKYQRSSKLELRPIGTTYKLKRSGKAG